MLAPFVTLLLWLAPVAAAEQLVDDAAFVADDECVAAPDSERCGLNALQLKRSRLGGLPSAAPTDGEETQEVSEKAACKDAEQGDACFNEVQWARTQGIQQHPEWYPEMTPDMPPADFQWIIHGTNPEKCPQPCSGTERKPPPPAPAPQGPLPTTPPMPVPPANPAACLCVFDIDRTLTAKQGSGGGECPGLTTVPSVEDNAYGGGELVLSEFSLNVGRTFCHECYLGFCSHGNADFEYSKEREVLLKRVLQSKPMKNLRLKPENAQWSDEELLTPFVVYSPDGEKQQHVARIREFYQRQGINVLPGQTYFFDDRANNVLPFKGTGMNARQISCESRDMDISNGAVGLCGATAAEIVREPGVVACPGFENAQVAIADDPDEDNTVSDGESDEEEAEEVREIPDSSVEEFQARTDEQARDLEDRELDTMEDLESYEKGYD